jgi:hypothetical protein
MTRDYYKVLLVGQSGKGKTYSFRNCDPLTTGFINVENKPLPFKNNFKHHKKPNTTTEVLEAIKEYATNPEIKAICIDSFSAYMDMALAEAKKTQKGFEIWNKYNDQVDMFNAYVKRAEKELYATAHYEILNIESSMEKRVKVKGKQHEGVIEKDYTIVLYADSKFDDKGKANYHYLLAGEGLSAKCPPDIFGPDIMKVDNDVQMINNKIEEFVK